MEIKQYNWEEFEKARKEVLDLDEIKFKRMAEQRIHEYQQARESGVMSAMSGTISGPDWHLYYMTDEERIELDLILARITRRYTSSVTDIADMIEVPGVLTMQEAMDIATQEFERLTESKREEINEAADRKIERENQKKQRIEEQHRARISRINNDAGRRGMQESTVITMQLEKVNQARDGAISALDAEISFHDMQRFQKLERLGITNDRQIEARARRIHNDAMRTNIQVIREIAAQKSRSYKDWLNYHQTRLTVPINIQSSIADESMQQIRMFLLKMHDTRPPWLLLYDPFFLVNFSWQLWNMLFDEFAERALPFLRPTGIPPRMANNNF